MVEAQARPVRVLLADDARVMRMLLKTYLQRLMRAEITEAEDGPTALRLADERRFDLMLLDVNMPGMTGLAVLEGVRRMPHHVQTPIIIITALGQEKHRERGMALGANAWVLKPLREMELVRALARLMPQALQPEAPRGNDAPDDGPGGPGST